MKKALLAGVCLLSLYFISQTIISQFFKNESLDGITIVLDAGHGGRDQGTSYEDVMEADLNLEIVMELSKLMEEAGANVVLTRKEDTDLSSVDAKNHKQEDLDKRLAIMDEENNDLYISIHMNSYPLASVHGTHVFYNDNNTASQTLAKIMQEKLNSFKDQKKDSKNANFYLLQKTKTTGVFIECGFLSNDKDRNELINPEYRQRLANVIYEGVLSYFNELAYD